MAAIHRGHGRTPRERHCHRCPELNLRSPRRSERQQLKGIVLGFFHEHGIEANVLGDLGSFGKLTYVERCLRFPETGIEFSER